MKKVIEGNDAFQILRGLPPDELEQCLWLAHTTGLTEPVGWELRRKRPRGRQPRSISLAVQRQQIAMAVDYALGGESMRTIARRYKVDEKAVRLAVKRLAPLVAAVRKLNRD